MNAPDPGGTTLELAHDGLRLQAELAGPEDAPLVVLLHGFPDTPHSWDGVVPHLLSAGYQVLRPWLRGYTPGSASRTARYDLIAVAGDINAWRQSLAINQAHLVGHDWGAVITMVLNGIDPQPWRSLSALAVPPLPSGPELWKSLPVLPRQLRLSAYMGFMQWEGSAQRLSANNAAAVREIWQRWSPGWAFGDDDFAPTRAVFSDPELAWAATRYYRALFSLHKLNSRKAWRYLSAPPRAPLLALAGELDGCMHVDTHRRATASMRQPGKFHALQLPGCGHFLHAEQPQRVAEHLLEHFRQAERPWGA